MTQESSPASMVDFLGYHRAPLSRTATLEESGMPNQLTARLCKFIGKPGRGHYTHAPFHVTTHRGHIVQTFQSLELAIEAAELLGPDHYIVDRQGLQIWDPQRKLLRNEE